MSWTLVTGGAKRLGKEIALHLADQGYDLLIHYRNSGHEAKETARQCQERGVKADIIQADFLAPESLARFLEGLQDIKNLVNNVGAFYQGSSLNTPPDKWQQLFQLNLFAPLALSQGLAGTIRNKRGSIINIGSAGCGRLIAEANYTAYTASKMSLFLLTKALAKELAKEGVRVNMVSPGELDISESLLRNQDKIPMGRAGTPFEVAKVVAFLLDESNGYITGQNIEVGGGFAL